MKKILLLVALIATTAVSAQLGIYTGFETASTDGFQSRSTEGYEVALNYDVVKSNFRLAPILSVKWADNLPVINRTSPFHLNNDGFNYDYGVSVGWDNDHAGFGVDVQRSIEAAVGYTYFRPYIMFQANRGPQVKLGYNQYRYDYDYDTNIKAFDSSSVFDGITFGLNWKL